MAIKRAIKAGNKSIISFKKAIKVGEITQLVSKDKFSFSSVVTSGVTFTNNGNGSITAVGTTTAFITRLILSHTKLERLKKGHKYLISSGQDDNANDYVTINFYNDNGKILTGYSSFSSPIFTFDGIYYASNIGGIYIYERITGAEINRTYTPQLFDLTEMFGAGHEPATVAEFKAKFPEAYYPYQRAVLTAYNKVVRPCARKGEVVQLFNKNTYSNTQTKSGITATNNGDGSWTINGTATKDSFINFSGPLTSIVGGHKILICGNKENSNFKMGLLNQPIKDTGTGAIGIFNQSAAKTWGIEWANGAVINNVTIYPQLFDLTAMYGVGNEPKTLADFRKDFPESYYRYSPVQTKNLFDIRKVSGLISGQFGNLNYNLTKNLTQNSLKIRYGAYGNSAFLKEPIVLPAGTYTFSCNCDYDVYGGCRLVVGKKIVDKMEMAYIAQTNFIKSHHLVLTFTLTEETEVYLSLQGDGGPANYTNLNNVFFNIQLEKGSVATDYVPHDYI